MKERSAGILLHLTSLPSEYGIGDLGSNSKRFVDFLADSKIKIWQVLPLGPTGFGDSPYSAFSAFAGNPLLISPEKLLEENLIESETLKNPPVFPNKSVDYEKVINYKWKLLKSSYNFLNDGMVAKTIVKEFKEFKIENTFWLEDFSLFMSLKENYNFQPWNKWNPAHKDRNSKEISEWKQDKPLNIDFQKFVQYLFSKQWKELKNYANQKNIAIFGDISIFVAYDSSDVWGNPSLFQLDETFNPTFVAGVPPDYFSESGQLWGNPLYRWNRLKSNNYLWWIKRLGFTLKLFDYLRIDHFRGFESYWRVPASENTAINGKWVKGPSTEFFDRVKEELGDLPIIAEDLGVITKDVQELLQKTGFPGMKILQFAFGGENVKGTENRFLPHNYDPNCVVYTGTHDNQCSLDWFKKSSSQIRKHFIKYTQSDCKDPVGDLLRLAWSSVAEWCIVPFQDLLRLGDEARMNFPGTLTGNWKWRFEWDQIPNGLITELLDLNSLYER